jgi:hypothetical protein
VSLFCTALVISLHCKGGDDGDGDGGEDGTHDSSGGESDLKSSRRTVLP